MLSWKRCQVADCPPHLFLCLLPEHVNLARHLVLPSESNLVAWARTPDTQPQDNCDDGTNRWAGADTANASSAIFSLVAPIVLLLEQRWLY